jgi:hypothetical protein
MPSFIGPFFFLFFLGKQKRERKGYTYLKDRFMREEKMAIDRASSFPEADVDQALNPSQNKEFEVDPVSSDIATSKETRQVLLKFALISTNLYTQYRRK